MNDQTILNSPNTQSAEAFGRRLKDLMSAKGIKQVDLRSLAEGLGVKLGKSQVSQYVSGKTLPRRDTLAVLAQILEVDPEWLLVGEQACDEVSSPKTGTSSLIDSSANSSTSTKGSAMREFKKSSKLDNVLYDVRGPVVDEAARMEAEGTRILKLNIGNPAPFGFSTPDEVIYDMRQQLVDCQGYSDAKGLFGARPDKAYS